VRATGAAFQQEPRLFSPETIMDIQMKSVSHTYGSTEVLRDISIDIPTGKIVCLVGPSGCGKSTLLRFIGGLERPTEGEVLQLGEPPEGSLNPLTYVFQDFALLPWRSVRGNISLVLEDHGIRGEDANRIIRDVLQRTKLSDFETALPKQLSGGMKQRVAIARALAVNPAVMLMDEPLSALDAQTRELLMDDLVALWTRQPFTAVYVTHNLAEAVRLGHKVVVLSRRPGQIREIVEIDTPLAERETGDPELEAVQKKLWNLMRDEARAADEELVNV
jgi:NitT/TauT family transport system ATP-binding protein